MPNTIKAACIGALALIIGSVISGLFTRNSQDTASKTISNIVDSGNANNAGRDINNAGRDNLNAGRDVNVTNIYEDTSKRKEKIESKQRPSIIIDERVSSNNQQGGITAHTVIIPEDKEVDLKDNFDYSITEENGGVLISFWPKQGKWNGAFFAVSLYEFDKVVPKFSIGNSIVTNDQFNDTNNMKFYNKENELVSCYQIGSRSEEVSRNRPGKVFCNLVPSEFAFGEYANLKKSYMFSKKRQ
jgi:hypothetical protein